MSTSQLQQEISIRFLLQEFAQTEAERLRLKSEAVHRINFFVTLTSAAGAGLIVLSQSNPHSFKAIALVIVFFLTLIGWQTLTYLINRDISTDRLLRSTGRIRRYFQDHNPTITPYLTWQPHDEPTKYVSHNDSASRRIVQTINAFLLAVGSGLCSSMLTTNPIVSILIGCSCFFGSLLGFVFYARSRFARALYDAQATSRFSRQQPSPKYYPSADALLQSLLME